LLKFTSAVICGKNTNILSIQVKNIEGMEKEHVKNNFSDKQLKTYSYMKN